MSNNMISGIMMVVLCLLAAFSGSLLSQDKVLDEDIEKENVYHGPVRPGDDEAHFRKTGETIPGGKING